MLFYEIQSIAIFPSKYCNYIVCLRCSKPMLFSYTCIYIQFFFYISLCIFSVKRASQGYTFSMIRLRLLRIQSYIIIRFQLSAYRKIKKKISCLLNRVIVDFYTHAVYIQKGEINPHTDVSLRPSLHFKQNIHQEMSFYFINL